MQKILLSILVLALAHSSQAFLPAAHRLPLRPSRSAVSRPAMSLSIPDNVIVAASNAYTLLADVGFDSDGSKVDRLYNGKALTGAVEVRRPFQSFGSASRMQCADGCVLSGSSLGPPAACFVGWRAGGHCGATFPQVWI
eukprot:1897800-Rhodomonas_salina.1